ncbi:hypothetical protein PGT21_006880 [Puccinia graminis f. sp. tritici]|uniref:Uncharacterized protein n=1 Tax=Puccinia graminis f. sp. tritici TaxID=56615 RepID=A0A5B0PJ94_PUCGR|nr:hypothetical protein PGT21_006880 [Puccinia graminis f. sp. tritici]
MENLSTNTPSGSGPQLQYQRELVINGFTNLERKYSSERTSIEEDPWSFPFNHHGMNSREVLYDRLFSTLLPRLKDQITAISATLDPVNMKTDPVAKLKRVLEIQSELDYNITQIDCAFLVICPENVSADDHTDDQGLEHFKAYRLVELKNEFTFALKEICRFFRVTSMYIQQMRPKLRGFFGDINISNCGKSAKDAVYSIEHTIKHPRRSELDIVANKAKRAVCLLDERLIDFISLVDPDAPPGYLLHRRFDIMTHQPLIHLAKLTIPIMKLSNLFFKKLSQLRMNCQAPPLFTQMNSDQLKSLCESTESVVRNLSGLMHEFYEVDEMFEDQAVDFRSFTQSVEQITTCLEGPLLSVLLYLVPLTNNPRDENYYQSWFAAWNTTINTAIRKFVQAAKNLQPNHLA